MSESRQGHTVRGSLVYFFLFAAFGSTMPFMPLIWTNKGLSEHQVGVLGAVRPFVSFLVTPFACSLADAYGVQRQMVQAAMIAYPVCLSNVLLASNFLGIVAVEVSSSVSYCPITSLIDSFVIQSSGTDGYGNQRLWGAVGFGLASLLAGYVSDASDGEFFGTILVFVGFMVFTIAAFSSLPFGRAEKKAGSFVSDPDQTEAGVECTEGAVASPTDASVIEDDDSTLALVPGRNDGDPDMKDESVDEDGGDRGGVEHGLLSALRKILGSAESATFFMAVGLSGMGMGVIDNFLFIWVEELGGSRLLCGIARLIMCIAEVPFFSLSGWLIERLGVRTMIAIAQAAYFTRFIYYSVLENPWWVLPAEVLHGLTYAAMWTASISYANEIAPANMHSTFQGLVTGIHWGIGYGLGAMIGGVMYAGVGGRMCFGIGAVLPSLSMTLLLLPGFRWWYVARCCPRRDVRNRGSTEAINDAEYELVSKADGGSET